MRDTWSAWLYLAFTAGLGPIRSLQLLQTFGSVTNVISATYASLVPFIGRKLAQALASRHAESAVNQALAWAERPDCHLITLDDTDYPTQLAETSAPPLVLFARGRRELLLRPMLAMVGSRNATIQGQRTAREFANALACQGYTIVSGLACGIDAACHEGALKHWPSSTVAVIGNGIDRVYPASHYTLSHQLATEGLIISEFPLGSPPLPAHFPQRNRIIAGLAHGCLVVEASIRSGSLITAHYAMEAGREVMSIPGSIHNPQARGCHRLIKNGAKLIETIDDVLSELGLPNESIDPIAYRKSSHRDTTPLYQPLLDAMGTDTVDVEILSEQLELTAGELYAMLLELELNGQVAILPGSRFQRLF